MRGRGRYYQPPVISPEATQEYFDRIRKDYEFLKQVPEKELRAELYALGFRFVTEPRHAQLVCLTIATYEPGWLFLLPPGAGKSKIIIDLIRWHHKQGRVKRALILAPELMHVYSWEEQLATHGPDLKTVTLLGNSSKRQQLLKKDFVVGVMNYKGLETYMTSLKPDPKKKQRKKRVIDADLAAEFALCFQMVGFDESHRLGNHKSLLFHMGVWLREACDFVYGATGTAFRRDPSMLWSQFYLMDGGQTLCDTLGKFRALFFTAKQHYFKGVEYEFKEELRNDLSRVIRNKSIYYDDKELNKSLPPKIFLRKPVVLSAEARDYFDRIVKKLKEERGDYTTLKNPYVRMRQVSSGYLSLKADDDSRIQVRFKENVKLDALKQLVIEQREGDKYLIYYEFRPSGDWICEMLEDQKIGFSRLSGGMKDIEGEYQRFLKQDKRLAFVINNALGSEAINPQYVCHREIFYETPDDPIQRTQAERRIWRDGQKYTSFITDIYARGTLDAKLLRYNQEGRNLLQAIMRGDETLAGEEEDEDV